MARVSGESVQGWRKGDDERRAKFGGDNKPKPVFVEEAAAFPAVLVGIFHTRSSKCKWGVAFVFMRLDTSPPEFIAFEAWNADMVHQVIVGGFGWVKGYENGLPENPDNWGKFNPESEILNEMWEIATCKDLKAKDGKWLPSLPAGSKRSPYVVLKTGIETYNDKDRAKVKYVNRSNDVGADGPYYVGDFRQKYIDASKDGGPIKTAKAWYEDWYSSCVRKAEETARKQGGGNGGGRQQEHDSFEGSDDDLPF